MHTSLVHISVAILVTHSKRLIEAGSKGERLLSLANISMERGYKVFMRPLENPSFENALRVGFRLFGVHM